jgi:putative FmdB family regulatory protein
MPIYEYECRSCHKPFEYNQSIHEAKKTTCESCGGPLERVISPSGFILKGGGWYKDLYSSAKKPAAENKSDAKSETKSETKSESKSDAAVPAKSAKE